MVTTINAQATTGLLTSADGSGIVQVQSNGKTVTALAWVNFNGTLSGSIAPRASFNVSSVTKNATGDYTITFSNPMSDTNYCTITTRGNFGGNGGYGIEAPVSQAPTTTTVRVGSWGTAGLFVDPTYAQIVIFGNS